MSSSGPNSEKLDSATSDADSLIDLLDSLPTPQPPFETENFEGEANLFEGLFDDIDFGSIPNPTGTEKTVHVQGQVSKTKQIGNNPPETEIETVDMTIFTPNQRKRPLNVIEERAAKSGRQGISKDPRQSS